MPLLRNGRIAADIWTGLAEDAPAPEAGPIVVSLARWRAERQTWIARAAPIGVRLKNTDAVADLAPDLAQLGLIVLEFPKFTDGRAYSQARLLRERLGYSGELRATGQVLIDQLLLMQRSGFDSFEIDRDDAEQALRQAQGAFAAFYQPTGDGRATIPELRRRLRAAAGLS